METVNPNGNKSYKMKGHTLPGINQNMDKTNLPDGRAGSSAVQLTIGGSRVDVFDKEGGEGSIGGSGTASDPTAELDAEGNPISAAKAIYTEEEKTGKSAGGIDYDEPAKGPNLPM